ncbi:hypothetical protein BC831DRAFT_482324 [Entophlyctis helioformis]|nr:hypothetical protein BC831DRAFT_482324 [Entophlyctis helioformis]
MSLLPLPSSGSSASGASGASRATLSRIDAMKRDLEARYHALAIATAPGSAPGSAPGYNPLVAIRMRRHKWRQAVRDGAGASTTTSASASDAKRPLKTVWFVGTDELLETVALGNSGSINNGGGAGLAPDVSADMGHADEVGDAQELQVQIGNAFLVEFLGGVSGASASGSRPTSPFAPPASASASASLFGTTASLAYGDAIQQQQQQSTAFPNTITNTIPNPSRPLASGLATAALSSSGGPLPPAVSVTMDTDGYRSDRDSLRGVVGATTGVRYAGSPVPPASAAMGLSLSPSLPPSPSPVVSFAGGGPDLGGGIDYEPMPDASDSYSTSDTDGGGGGLGLGQGLGQGGVTPRRAMTGSMPASSSLSASMTLSGGGSVTPTNAAGGLGGLGLSGGRGRRESADGAAASGPAASSASLAGAGVKARGPTGRSSPTAAGYTSSYASSGGAPSPRSAEGMPTGSGAAGYGYGSSSGGGGGLRSPSRAKTTSVAGQGKRFIRPGRGRGRTSSPVETVTPGGIMHQYLSSQPSAAAGGASGQRPTGARQPVQRANGHGHGSGPGPGMLPTVKSSTEYLRARSQERLTDGERRLLERVHALVNGASGVHAHGGGSGLVSRSPSAASLSSVGSGGGGGGGGGGAVIASGGAVNGDMSIRARRRRLDADVEALVAAQRVLTGSVALTGTGAGAPTATAMGDGAVGMDAGGSGRRGSRSGIMEPQPMSIGVSGNSNISSISSSTSSAAASAMDTSPVPAPPSSSLTLERTMAGAGIDAALQATLLSVGRLSVSVRAWTEESERARTVQHKTEERVSALTTRIGRVSGRLLALSGDHSVLLEPHLYDDDGDGNGGRGPGGRARLGYAVLSVVLSVGGYGLWIGWWIWRVLSIVLFGWMPRARVVGSGSGSGSGSGAGTGAAVAAGHSGSRGSGSGSGSGSGRTRAVTAGTAAAPASTSPSLVASAAPVAVTE